MKYSTHINKLMVRLRLIGVISHDIKRDYVNN